MLRFELLPELRVCTKAAEEQAVGLGTIPNLHLVCDRIWGIPGKGLAIWG